MEQTAKTNITRKVRNNRVAKTLNETAKTLGCNVELDHNQMLVLQGQTENVEKCVKLLEVMHNHTELGHIDFENGTRYSIIVLNRNKVAA